jgi:CubicO group peptidase (beta-lactamase class C family)
VTGLTGEATPNAPDFEFLSACPTVLSASQQTTVGSLSVLQHENGISGQPVELLDLPQGVEGLGAVDVQRRKVEGSSFTYVDYFPISGSLVSEVAADTVPPHGRRWLSRTTQAPKHSLGKRSINTGKSRNASRFSGAWNDAPLTTEGAAVENVARPPSSGIAKATFMKAITLVTLVLFGSSTGFGAGLPRSRPEAQGVSPSAVLSFVEAADKNIEAMNSFMLLRHGFVVAEGWWSPYEAESPHSLYSLSKSFASTAVGLAIAEGKLSLDDEVLKFFPEDAPPQPSANLKSMRVSDLLRMSTGQQTEPARTPDQPWTKTFLAQPVPFKPGTHFLYNTSGTYMLSAIVQKATGMTVLDYLRPRLFEPLGIEHPTWETSPQGITAGGYGLSIRTEDIARFGQLYLQRGAWRGKQLIPKAWVDAATARQTSNGSNPASDWDQGYGYQFWRCRHGAYRGDGAFGQYCIVLPAQDAVIVITSGVKDMQAVLNLVWEKLLPGLKRSPLPDDDSSRAKLEQKLKLLVVRPQEGSGTAANVAGKKYVFAANRHRVESITLMDDGKDGQVTLVIRQAGKVQQIACGRGTWCKGRMGWGLMASQPAAGSGEWTADGTFNAKICFYETPFIVTVRLKFSDRQLQCDAEANVGFGPTNEPRLTGKTE